MPIVGDKFEPIRGKIRRSIYHSGIEDGRAKECLGNPQSYHASLKPEGKEWLYKLLTVPQLPLEFAIGIGEAAHQLRSVLDHLAFLFSRPLVGEELQVEFPFTKSRKNFDSCCPVKLPGASSEVRAIIEGLQPYHRDNANAQALNRVRVIDNWDKHREIVGSAASITGIELGIINPEGLAIEHQTFMGILEPGAILARLTIEQRSAGLEVAMKPHLDILPIFSNRMPEEIRGQPILKTIGEAGKFIRDTLLPEFMARG